MKVRYAVIASMAALAACGKETPTAPAEQQVVAVETRMANATNVYLSGSHVDAYGPIYQYYPNWTVAPCSAGGALALNGSHWGAPHAATVFPAGTHPWEASLGYFAPWINAWGNISSVGGPNFVAAGNPDGYNWTKYETQVEGNGSFELRLIADNCSWIYIDGTLVGYQDDAGMPKKISYGVTLNGKHKLTFVIFDGGGSAGGMYRMETTTNPPPPLNPDLDGDGHNNDTDAFPLDPTEWQDTDGDGHGNNGDYYPNDPTRWEKMPDTIVLQGLVRDFRTTHPDFESFVGDDRTIVAPLLGADGLPVYAGNPTTPSTHGQGYFDQWYRNVPGVNLAKQIDLVLQLQPDGTYRYTNNDFYPIDNQLFGNDGNGHNYHFTTEFHTNFTFKGGETFAFSGDDDVFVYINGRLVVNLGGVHGVESGSVALNTLGLTVGQSYPLDIFQAERHCCGSNFSMTTSLQLVSEPPPPIPTDNTPPTVAAVVTGTQGTNGWYTSDVNVSWNVNDGESAITSPACVASVLSSDSNGVTYSCTATSEGGSASASVTVKRDATAPTMAPTVSGTEGANGWYVGDVTVSWAVADGMSGIASSAGCAAVTTSTDNTGTAYTCTATDAAGNVTTKSVSAKRDASAPSVAGAVSGTIGDNGWYTSNVGVTWSVNDGISGIGSSTGCSATTTSTDNSGTTYTCSATNGAGLTTTKSVTAKRDATMPAIGYAGNAGSYTVDQTVAITCSASDAMSGLASNTCANIGGAAYTFAIGANSYSASAKDNAGNTNAATAAFSVVVTGDATCKLVERFVSNQGVANSLCVKIRQKSWGAFRNEVSAQTGKKLSAEHAVILLRMVDELD